jgi:WD40 repeat protein
MACGGLGDLDAAQDHLHRALSIRGLGRRRVIVLAGLGQVHLRRDDTDVGHAAWSDFLDIAEGIRSVKDTAAIDAIRARAAGGGDGTVRLWDPVAGTPVGELLEDHTGRVTAMEAFAHPEGRTLLATTGWDGAVRLWDPARGKPFGKPLKGHAKGVTATAGFAHPDGHTLLATVSYDSTVRVRDPIAGNELGVLPTEVPAQVIQAVGDMLAVTTYDGILLVAFGAQ